MDKEIAICLAAYNGEKYLKQQIESIIVQSNQNWKLYIRDDGSCDGTCDIIKRFVKQYPEKIIWVKSGSSTRSFSKNFMSTLKYATSKSEHQYFMFCDQDDVWFSDKIEESLRKLKKIQDGEDDPALVYTDGVLVDSDLNVIADSVAAYRHYNYENVSLQKAILFGYANGCTMLWNRGLNNLIRFDVDLEMYHDKQISLLAASCGKKGYLNKPTMLFRTHAKNESSSHNKAQNILSVPKLAYNMLFKNGLNNAKENYADIYRCASNFFCAYKSVMPEESQLIFTDFRNIANASFLKRKYLTFKKGFLRNTTEGGLVEIITQLIIC